jgi:signal transduction histidine kinase
MSPTRESGRVRRGRAAEAGDRDRPLERAVGRPLRSPSPGPVRSRLRLRQWLTLVGGVTVMVVLVALAAGALATLRVHSAIATLTDYATPAALGVLQFEQSALKQEAGVREYTLTGDPELLRLYDDGRRDEAETARQIEAALAEGPARAAADYELARRQLAAWRSGYAEPVIADVRSRGPAAVDSARADQGGLLFAQVTSTLERQQAGLLTERAEARDRLRRAESFLYASYAAIALSLLLVAVMFGLALQHSVSLPLARLGAGTRRVTTGDFSHKVEASGIAEVTELANDIEAMRHRIVEELSAVRAAEAQLREQAIELSEQAAELRRSNAELEQFAYVASHDLQEPLRKVASFCQMLQRRYAGTLDERADQYIFFAVDGAKRMQTLINDLLAFSRVGRITREHVVVDCDDVLRHVLDGLGTMIEETEAKVTADDLPAIPADPTLLRQLLQNLVANAIKFHGDEPPRVHLSARRDGDMWEFACSDNGIGIDPQYADRIFIIFQRLHPKEEYPGTGLGLALCKKIVEYHGGRIWLDPESANGRGTTIRWTMPATAPDANSTEQPAAGILEGT